MKKMTQFLLHEFRNIQWIYHHFSPLLEKIMKTKRVDDIEQRVLAKFRMISIYSIYILKKLILK